MKFIILSLFLLTLSTLSHSQVKHKKVNHKKCEQLYFWFSYKQYDLEQQIDDFGALFRGRCYSECTTDKNYHTNWDDAILIGIGCDHFVTFAPNTGRSIWHEWTPWINTGTIYPHIYMNWDKNNGDSIVSDDIPDTFYIRHSVLLEAKKDTLYVDPLKFNYIKIGNQVYRIFGELLLQSLSDTLPVRKWYLPGL